MTHSLRTDRKVEKSGQFASVRIIAAHVAEIATSELTGDEQAIWIDSFVETMGQPAPEEEAFFARRRQLGLGVGLDAAGDLAREDAATRG
jgi:hypothetical protein